MVKGVKEGYEKRLEIEGVGYRPLFRQKLVLNLGYSHPIEIEPPRASNLKLKKTVLSSAVLIKSGRTNGCQNKKAAEAGAIQGQRIRYQGEVIKIKAVRKAVSGGM